MKDIISSDLTIRVYFFWRAYPRQSSNGLLGNLLQPQNQRLKVDCDACVMAMRDGRPIGPTVSEAIVCNENLSMFDGALAHGGDNMNSDKNAEYIEVKLAGIPETVDELQFIFNIFKGEELVSRSARLHRITIRVKEAETLNDLEEVEINRPDTTSVRAFSGCSLVRDQGGWKLVRRFRAFQGAESYQDLLEA